MPARSVDPFEREIEVLFRRESGRLVARLCGVFGSSRLQLAEDVVQETMVRALRAWRFQGFPENPSAWMLRAARNLAIDRLRRDRWLRDREPELEGWGLGDSADGHGATPAAPRFAHELSDDQLALVFLCCHPRVPRAGRVALTLRAAGGFTAAEIARALLTTPQAVGQSLARAKAIFRRLRAPLSIPAADELRAREDLVLDALYVMFSQGYDAQRGWELIRRDVCEEAMRLAESVAAHAVTGDPTAHALAALFSFHAARFPARVGDGGELVLLRDQDRARYDRATMERGVRHLAAAGRGDRLSGYHLEADIASCHTLARSYDETDWGHIVACYDGLLRLNPSPTIAVNRAVALARVEGPVAALAALEPLRRKATLRGYLPLRVALAECYRELGRSADAREALKEALALEANAPTRRHLERRLAATPSLAE
ncbi:MAG TPA: sigma-70 family RNA polymerase sigma factor [Candidatus Eisenbacteria bacterium]|nr:sigma-70 family RNA polymerase sigma factor [Candidatus Eisenbacteria bacterium]